MNSLLLLINENKNILNYCHRLNNRHWSENLLQNLKYIKTHEYVLLKILHYSVEYLFLNNTQGNYTVIYGYIVVCDKQITSKHVYISIPYKTIECYMYMFNTC